MIQRVYLKSPYQREKEGLMLHKMEYQQSLKTPARIVFVFSGKSDKHLKPKHQGRQASRSSKQMSAILKP